MEFKDMSNVVLGNIMSRLGAKALASVACTSSELRELARDEAHWRPLCNSPWPSTQLAEARRLISSSASGGFTEFYGIVCPLIVYDHKAATREIVDVHNSSCDLVSLVDVFLNDRCVLSRVVDGILGSISDQKLIDRRTGEKGSENRIRFLSSPFQWDSVDLDQANEDGSEEEFEDGLEENPPSEYSGLKELVGILRLSWILLDKKTGVAVNLSRWKPWFIRRNGPGNDNYMVKFGCVVTSVDELDVRRSSAKFSDERNVKKIHVAGFGVECYCSMCNLFLI